ncbi:serine/threonine protein kinase [archaeon]|nr:serine/threonine protein kinase [archaeon]
MYCVREHRFGKKIDGLDAFKGMDLFGREYDVLKGLDHPQIPKVHDLFEHQEGRDYSLFMAQQLVPGECLEKIVEREGPLAEEKIVDVMLQLTDVLKYLHTQIPAVVHRDIKPSNIMLDKESGKLYLIDFGIVQQRIAKTIGGSTMFGTMGYSAPEVFAGQATTKSDLYSIGPTILKLASGISPEDLLNGFNLDYHGKFEFKNPSLGVLVDQLTQFDPALRPKSIDEVAKYLQQIKEGKTLSRRTEGGRLKRFFSRLIPRGLFQYMVRSRHEEAKRELQNGVIVEGEKVLPTPPVTSYSGSGFFIEELADRYRIHGVIYNGAERTVDWSKKLLHGGEALTQDQHIERLKGKEWKLADAELYTATIMALYENRAHPDTGQNKLVKKVKEMFADDFRKHWVMTGTRARYRSNKDKEVVQEIRYASGNDDVIHDYKQPEQRTVEEDLVGPDGWIHATSGLQLPVHALLGISDLDNFGNACEWLSGKKPYLWRLNSRPDTDTERAVVLGVGGGRFGIGASSFDNRRPARGMSCPARQGSILAVFLLKKFL